MLLADRKKMVLLISLCQFIRQSVTETGREKLISHLSPATWIYLAVLNVLVLKLSGLSRFVSFLHRKNSHYSLQNILQYPVIESALCLHITLVMLVIVFK